MPTPQPTWSLHLSAASLLRTRERCLSPPERIKTDVIDAAVLALEPAYEQKKGGQRVLKCGFGQPERRYRHEKDCRSAGEATTRMVSAACLLSPNSKWATTA
jgi:hypothetical protein